MKSVEINEDGFTEDGKFKLVSVEPTDLLLSEMESAASFGIGKPVDDEAIKRVWRAGLGLWPER